MPALDKFPTITWVCFHLSAKIPIGCTSRYRVRRCGSIFRPTCPTQRLRCLPKKAITAALNRS